MTQADLVSLILAAAAPARRPEAHHVGVWNVLGPVGLVIGIIAGTHQIVDVFRRRRFRKAEERILSAVSATIDAEEAKREAAKYESVRAALRRQVEEEVPLEARRVFLMSRRDALRTQIASDVDEYSAIERELADMERRQPADLDERLRPIVERSILPPYVRRRRAERVVVATLVLLVLGSFVPRGWLAFQWDNYAHAIDDPAEYGKADLLSSLAAGAITAGALGMLATRAMLQRVFPKPVVMKALAAIATSIAVAGSFLICSGLLLRHSVGEPIHRAEGLANTELKTRMLAETTKSAAHRHALLLATRSLEVRSDRIFAQEEATNRHASSALWPGHWVFGVGLGMSLALAWRRHGHRRSKSRGVPAVSTA